MYLLQGDDLHAEAMPYDSHKLPQSFEQVLPIFEWPFARNFDMNQKLTMVFTHLFQGDSTNAEVAVYEGDQLPNEYVNQLPSFRPNERHARSHIGITEGRFVHQAVGQVDPNVIFSRDVMHQNRPKDKTVSRDNTK